MNTKEPNTDKRFSDARRKLVLGALSLPLAGFGARGASADLDLRRVEAWFWVLMSGMVSLLIGGLIFAQVPQSAASAIGMLVGLNMIATDFSFVALARAAGKIAEVK
jgi:uncharacterized membrane protein HdeD (DUF308 family)